MSGKIWLRRYKIQLDNRKLNINGENMGNNIIYKKYIPNNQKVKGIKYSRRRITSFVGLSRPNILKMEK
jgi:hypothetical protein